MILTKIIIYSFSIFLFSLLWENSAYAGCAVEGTMTKAKITTEATEGNDVTSCDVSGLTDLSSVFINITGFNQDIGGWDTSNVTTMANMFDGATSFNQDISDWDVSSVTTMYRMFYNADDFNNGGEVLDWSNTNSLTSIEFGFEKAESFNQSLNSWNFSNITGNGFRYVWRDATVFNNGGVTPNWNITSNVTSMTMLFFNAAAFDQPISGWNTSNVNTMSYMFSGSDFNQDISGWNVGNVTTMEDMFLNASAFNNGGAALDWSDTGSVTDMEGMFNNADAFNQDVSTWDVSSVDTMKQMFRHMSAFNNGGVPLDWANTSSVTNMQQLFYYTGSFNQPVPTSGNSWNVSNVTRMDNMFGLTTAFNQDLSSWNVTNVANFTNFLDRFAFSTSNYDLLLVAWDALNLTDSLSFSVDDTKYTGCSTAAIARANIVSTDSWTITDGGATSCVAPTLSSSTPADNATGIAENANIVLTFSLPVDVESGNITIKKTSDNSTVETIAVTNSKVTGTGTTQITINPATTLGSLTEYYVLIDATGFDNSNSDSYAGISSTTALSFTTGDNIAPSINSSSPGSPADNATGVAVDSNIVINFVEAVDAESGNITIHLTSDNSTIETIDVTGGQVSGSGTTQITINPANDLESATEYYILIDASAFDDSSGNSYAGISSTTALSFTTAENNPFLDPTIIALNQLQAEQAKKTMEESVKSIIDRIDLIRKMDSNITVQGIQLAFNLHDQFAKEVFTLASEKYLETSVEVDKKKWAVWTEGNISYGSVGETTTSLGQKIHSDGIMIGIDRKLTNDTIVGFAVSTVWQETQVGGNQAVVDTDAYSFLTYSSLKINDSSHFDSLIGLGEMDIDFVRQVTGGENTGNRDGRQIYGSVAYSLEPNQQWKDAIEKRNPSLEMKYYSRLDLGYTFFNEYKESGVADKTLHYNNHHIKNGSLSIGTTLNKDYKINNGSITPFLRFEGGASKTTNSLTEAYYNAKPSQLYTNSLNDKITTHTRIGLGIGAELDNDWSYNIVYDRQDRSNHSFTNNVYLNIRKQF